MDCTSVLQMSGVSEGGPLPWRRFGVRQVFESPEVSLAALDIGLPNHERVWLHLVRAPMAVAVVLLDGDRVLLVWRYRFAQERWGWELPGGQVDDDEGAAEAAARELDELTGFGAGRLDHLITYQPLAEIADAERVVMVGRDPLALSTPVGLDAGERAEWVPLADVPGLIAAGLIWNGSTVIGLLSVLAQNVGR